MAGSLKDALRKSGLAPEPPPKPKATPGKAPGFRDELPDDESLPPAFDAPALTRAQPASPINRPKAERKAKPDEE